jgi:hypothetical protein
MVRQCLSRSSLRLFAVFDFGLGNTLWDVQLKLDQELHQHLLVAPHSHSAVRPSERICAGRKTVIPKWSD